MFGTMLLAITAALGQAASDEEVSVQQSPAISPLSAIERTDDDREGRRIAAEIAVIYWQHERLAEVLLEAQAEFRFISDIVEMVTAGDPPSPALLAYTEALEAQVRANVREVGARYDLEDLLERAPRAGNILVRYIRYGADLETSERLLDLMTPTAGPGGLHPLMLESLQRERAARALANPDANTLPNTDSPRSGEDPQVDAFIARYEGWIDVVRLLGRLEGRDQFTRTLILGQIAHPLPDSVRAALIDANDPLISAIDSENAAAALSLVDRFGFDAINEAAPGAAGLIASIVQHSTPEDQRRLLRELEPLALSGQFSGQRYALMFDRVAVSGGQPQRYGTQSHCVAGRYALYPIEDEAGVDTRREQMGLGSLEAYRDELIGSYGETC